jgi:FdrA protein
MTSPPTTTQDTAGATHVEVRPGAYADSVTLLQVSKEVTAVPGVENAQVAMATPLNLDVLASMGFEVPPTTPNDMVVAVKLTAGGDLALALAAVEAALTRKAPSGGQAELEPHRTTGAALSDSDADLALVSVPGEHAFAEAMDALDLGRDVMVFSDNVPVDQEVVLKQRATERGVLVMGPDCGTAVVGGVGLGFANRTRPGPVGIVAASGTGCQQLMCLLDAAGIGVTAALGVGGRDLSSEVGGLSTREAMRRLDEDPSVELIVVVSKPPASKVATALDNYASSLGTPVQLALLGEGQPDLTEAAEKAVAALGRPRPEWHSWNTDTSRPAAGGHLRGLFVGGTLCKESTLITTAALGPVWSNIPLSADLSLGADLVADGHTMVDFGDDALTAGRAHPMIDPSLRLDNLARVAADGATAVVLLDVVLGHGAEPDPAASLAPAIRAAKETAGAAGRDLPVVVACVGTEDDPQRLSAQARALADAGAEVFLSNAQATRRAIDLTGGCR